MSYESPDVLIYDGYGNGPAAVKAPSTAAAATDTALVVALSPNSPTPAGTNTIGSVSITADGYVADVTGPSTVPTAIQKGLVVSISPNSSISGVVQSDFDPSIYATPTGGYLPVAPGPTSVLKTDPFGHLEVRGPIYTDEQGYRDSFSGSSLTTTLTGTLTFTNGSTTVTGSGTSFSTQTAISKYIKLSADSETAYAQIGSVANNTTLYLVTPYTGTSTAGAAVISTWATTTGTGSLTVASSVLSMASGTASGATTYIAHDTDYIPINLTAIASFTPGTGASQTAFIGFMDVPSAPTQQVIVEFDNSLATNQVRFITSNSAAASEISNQIITLPYGALVTQLLHYEVSVTQNMATLQIGLPNTAQQLLSAYSEVHLPLPYTVMSTVAGLANSASITSSGTLAIDSMSLNDQDRIEVALSFSGEPITTMPAADTELSIQTITAYDTGSSSNTMANGQVYVTGTATANSTATYYMQSTATARIQTTGSWAGTLTVEESVDGGTTWVLSSVRQSGTAWVTNNFTNNFVGITNVAAGAQLRVRATSGSWSGTATIKVINSLNESLIFVGAPIRLSDGYTQSTIATVKAGSTAAAAADTSLVVALSPNSNAVSITGDGYTVDVTGASASATVSQKALVVALSPNSYDNSCITSPNAKSLGLFAQVTGWGTIKVSDEPGAIFTDTFDGTTLDTTNKWSVAGTGSYSVSSGILTLSTGTTASAWEAIQSIPIIMPRGFNFNVMGVIHQMDAAAVVNSYQFGGFGTYPTTPTTSAPLTDAVGFEVTAAGALNAVVYASGTKIFNQALTRPSDGYLHRYAVMFREDYINWCIDTVEYPVAIANFQFPNNASLPVLNLLINGSTPPATAPTYKNAALAVADSGCNSKSISDGTYPWRQSTVKPASTAAVATDPALVVAISPNNALSLSAADVTGTGALGALNAAVQVSTAGLDTAGFQLAAGTLIGTIIPEVSFDGGTTWNSTYFDTLSNSKVSTIVFASSNPATAATIVGVGGSGLSRVRVSAYTSGTANITVRATTRTDPSVLFAGPAAVAGPPSVAQIGGSVTTSAPSYTTGTLNILSLNTSGGLRVADIKDPNLTVIQNNATVTTSGSMVITGVGDKELNFGITISGTVSGTTPSLTYTVAEIDPVNLTTVMTLPGNSITVGPYTSTGHTNYAQMISYTGAVKVTWTISGASASFGGVDTWVTVKAQGNSFGLTFSGSSEPLSVINIDSSNNTIVVGPAAAGSAVSGNPVLTAGSDGTDARALATNTAGNLLVAQAAVAGVALADAWTMKITDVTNGPVAVKAASTTAAATDPALVVAISPNLPTLTKGTQGAVGFAIQELKDAGRVPVTLMCSAVAGVTTEALLSLTPNHGTTVSSAATTYAVTSGKTFRITAISVTVINTSTVASGAIINVRTLAGTVLVSSPIIFSVGAAVNGAVSGQCGTGEIEIPDGFEISGTQQLGLTQIASATTCTLSVAVIGFEY